MWTLPVRNFPQRLDALVVLLGQYRQSSSRENCEDSTHFAYTNKFWRYRFFQLITTN